MDKPIIILGAGSPGRSALEIFKSNGVLVYGFLDDNKGLVGKEIEDISVLGTTEDEVILEEIGKSAEAFIAIDENPVRKRLADYLLKKRGVMPVNAIHKSLIIAGSAELGHGNLISAGCVIGPSASMGNHCILNIRSAVDTGVKIGNLVQIGAGSIINSRVVIEDEVFIGSGVTVVSGVNIGKGARIGAGSVVVDNVKSGETVFGNPAAKVG
jgi:sugar O-acyltransferase (sialic acid O-acetyltransferase NeuD family)